ncbi:sister chromatid cohesion 1 protein 3-like isoform X1 [Lycium barbarum]|uniref:sister chromatid cohesion 1 protein 3-like isoform X1 n=3 Tax=Lycium barbarum TaxID=112863 RepID=UPI00293F4701|nr:sister chromatid cohesion 1 protein 3-like isoform X1 [Lycium barbarum]
MFYSLTLLGRKGPLATVWQAATIQSNLKKSQYASTNILSTVELIMFPQVPFALRQYGTLLLGVVRIHSKQVEYFFQDYRNLETGIRKAYSFTNVNLPEDATHASYHSITLPETFELDALDFDDDLDLNRFEDTHLKNLEEITLGDQILTREDQYVGIFIDEDIWTSLSKPGEVSGLGGMPMEIDSDPSNPDRPPAQSQNSSPKNQEALNRGTVREDIPQDIPEIEIMRDAVHDHVYESVPLWPDHGNDVMEADKVLEEQIMKDKETATPVVEEMVASGGHTLPLQQREEPPSTTAAKVQEFTNPQISFGHQSLDLALRSTPPPEEPKARRRKRKQKLDEDIVLSNAYIRRYLDDSGELKRNERRRKDTSELECQEKKDPFSLVLWKRNKRCRKDEMLFEPVLTGLCDDLCNIYKEGFISEKVKMSSSQEDHAEPSGNHSPQPVNDLGNEIERLRDNQDHACTNLLSEILPSPNKFISSPPDRRDDFTPATATVGTQSDQMGRTTESGALQTPDPAASTGLVGSDMETPSTWYEEGQGLENTVLSDIPEFDHSAGDLNFLDQDDDTLIDHLSIKQGVTPEFDTLPIRTRAMAQFLQGQSPVTPISEKTINLSLNTILEGKNRTICARMVFETLVLQKCGLVDVNQNEPYGDITLKVTSKLKECFVS